MRQKQIAVITAASMGLAVCVLLAGFGWATPALPGPSGYHILKTIPLPGTEGWDYLTMDSAARILYISRGNHIDAVNVDTGALVGKVTGVEGTNGLLPVPELGRGFVTNEDKSEVVILRTRDQARLHHEQRRKQCDGHQRRRGHGRRYDTTGRAARIRGGRR